MKVDREYNDELAKILFFCILLSLSPIVLSSTIYPALSSGLMFNISVGAMFLFQTAVFSLYYLINFKKVFDRNIFLFSLIFAATQIITILISSLASIEVNFLDLINIFARFINVFIFFCIPSRYCISKKGLYDFMLFIVVLGFVSCIFNIIVNYHGIRNVFNIYGPYAVNFKSFYLNRNSFAQLLLLATIANTFVWTSKKSILYLLNYIAFFINIILTFSRTVVVSVSLFLFIFFFTYYRKRNLVRAMLLIFAALAICFICLNQDINNFVSEMVIRKDMGTSSRGDLWTLGIQILNNTNWIFGVGYITSSDYIKLTGFSEREFHNFYVETLVGGGVVDLLLHLLLFIFIFKRINHIYKNDESAGILYYSSYIILMIYAFFESISFLTMGYVGTVFSILFITIPLLYSNSFSCSIRNRIIDKNLRGIVK